MKYLLPFLAMVLLATSCGESVEGLTPEEYISQNNLVAEELDNGVYIVVEEEGNDNKPGLDHVIQVSFVGTLTNGEVFDSSDDYKQLLGNLIPGWYIGLRELGVGGSCKLIIPHEMGFGNVELENVPPRSTLVFDIELKNIFTERTVSDYILDNDLETEELEQGVHIVIHDPGNTNRPTEESSIVVNYTGKLTNELVFDQGTNVSFILGNLIQGWQIGLKQLGEGGSCTLVLPSEVAYGSSGAGSIPPNAPLVFDLELIKVE